MIGDADEVASDMEGHGEGKRDGNETWVTGLDFALQRSGGLKIDWGRTGCGVLSSGSFRWMAELLLGRVLFVAFFVLFFVSGRRDSLRRGRPDSRLPECFVFFSLFSKLRYYFLLSS
jgi:hypothetical protein